MQLHATFKDRTGWWYVLRIKDGTSDTVVSCFEDSSLACRIRDFLDNEERIWQLLDRHGEVDVPISEVPS